MRKVVPAAFLICFIALLPSLVIAQMQDVSEVRAASFTCDLTKANGRYLPDSAVPGSAQDFFGNDSIAIGVGAEGRTITFRPGGAGFVLPDGALQWKFLWAKVRLPMSIEGRRLDAPAPALRSHLSHEFDNQNFQPSSLIFPTPGCWEITSRVGQDKLTFVVNVVRIGEGPSINPDVRQRQSLERMRPSETRDVVDRLFLKP